MRKSLYKFFMIFFMLFLIILQSPIYASDYEGKIIKMITFEGIKKAEIDKIKPALFIAEGMIFKDKEVEKDIKNLYDYGYFDDVKLDVSTNDEGKLILKYIIKEKPWIRKIIFKGNDEISEDDLKNIISNREKFFYDQFENEMDQKKIIEEYVKEGFIGTKVKFRIEKATNEEFINYTISNERNNQIYESDYDEEIEDLSEEIGGETEIFLIIEVNEGEIVKVENIDIKGTKFLSPDYLKGSMKNISEPGLLRLSMSALNPADYEMDKLEIIKAAKEKGFLSFKILDTKQEIKVIDKESGQKGYYLTIYVDEGEQYTYSGINIKGNKRIEKKQIVANLALEMGEIYNDKFFTSFLRSSYIDYQSNGFFYAKVTPIPDVDEDKKFIEYLVDIYEGDKVHIENMYIIGNSKSDTKIIDRELRIKEGEIYDLSKLLRSRERLMKSQYFSNAIFEPRVGSEDGLIDVFWKVEEAKTGMLTMGGGYGTLSGFTLFGQISELNLFGLGYNTSLRFDYGQKKQSISTSFSSRWIGYTPLRYNITLSYSWQQLDIIPKYDRDQDGSWDKIDSGGTTYEETGAGGIGDNIFDITDEDRNGDGTLGSNDDLGDDRYVNKKSIGIGLGLGYSLSEYWEAGANQSLTFNKYYSPKNITVANLYQDDTYRLKSLLQDGGYDYTTRTAISVGYDSTDNYLTPTKGFKFDPSVSFYGLMGGYNKFTQIGVDLSAYITLIKHKRAKWNLVWANHLAATSITQLPGKSDPDLYAEYRLGFDGIRELRGWGELVYEEDLKGLGKISFGSELRIPIPGTTNLLWWAFFFDAGNISEEKATLPDDLTKFKFSHGFGLKIEIPMFPIRLYFAKRMLWEDGWFKETSDYNFVLSIAGFF